MQVAGRHAHRLGEVGDPNLAIEMGFDMVDDAPQPPGRQARRPTRHAARRAAVATHQVARDAERHFLALQRVETAVECGDARQLGGGA